MKLEVGKEYYCIDLKTKCKPVYISDINATKCLVVYKSTGGCEYAGWVSNDCLKELPPTAGSNGEYVHRSYLYYFKDGRSGWQYGGEAISCDLIRRLATEEQKEHYKCK